MCHKIHLRYQSLFLPGVLQDLVMDVLEFHAGHLEHFLGFGSGMVLVFGHHLLDAAVDNQHRAGAAGGHRAVQGAAFQGHAPASRLADGILLGMDRPDAMGRDAPVLMQNFAEKMAYLVAVGQVGRRTHIARH